MSKDLKDFTEKLKDFGKKIKNFERNFDDFPRFVIAGDRAKPGQTVLKCYLSKSTMISIHHESNGNGFVFVNYKTRATVLKNISAYEIIVSENDFFQALAEKIFYYFTIEPNMKKILTDRRKRLGTGGAAFALTTGDK